MFVPLLPDPPKDQVLNEILQILLTIKAGTIATPKPEKSLSSTIERLAPHIPALSFQEWLEVVNKFESPIFQVIATATLASHLPTELKEKVVSEALQVARSIENAPGRALAFTGLTPHLPQHQKGEVLCEALQIAAAYKERFRPVEELRILLFAKLAPHLTKLPPYILYRAWRTTLHVLATRTRQAFVRDLVALSPVLLTLGGNTAIEETIQAIEDIGQWWP